MSVTPLTTRERVSLAILALLLALCGCLMHCGGMRDAGHAEGTQTDSVSVVIMPPTDSAETGDRHVKARESVRRKKDNKKIRRQRHDKAPVYRSPLDEPLMAP